MSLTFVRKASKAKDGYDGFLYRHSWPGGFQELIFPSKEAAEKWRSAETEPKIVEQKYVPSEIRYVVTAIRNGARTLAFHRQARYSYETREQAEQKMKDTIFFNNPETIEELVGRDLEVRPVECYPGGDPVTCWFE